MPFGILKTIFGTRPFAYYCRKGGPLSGFFFLKCEVLSQVGMEQACVRRLRLEGIHQGVDEVLSFQTVLEGECRQEAPKNWILGAPQLA